MIFHFPSLIFSLIFFFFLWWYGNQPTVPSWSWYLTAILPLLALSLFAAKRLTGRFRSAYLPGVVSFSVALLLSLIDIPFEEKAFILSGTGLYYLSLLSLYRFHLAEFDQTAAAMQNLAALASLFFIYAGAYGLYLNYDVPLWLLMLVFASATGIVTYQTLRGLSRKHRRLTLMASLVASIIFGELVWLLHFWPFGYLTTGIITLMLFYGLWKLVQDAITGNFSQKEFLTQTVIVFLLILVLLGSTPWRMLV